MNYKIKKGQIKPYLKSKNEFLRSNAITALISLSDENFSILDDYPHSISKVDELKILDIIYQKKISIPENINKWLNSKNDSIVIIAIKLIVRYRYEYIIENNQIKYLISHDNKMVRKEIVQAIRELISINAREIVTQHYKIEKNRRLKISILKTLAVIGNHETINFCEDILKNEIDLDIKMATVFCVYKIDEAFFNKIDPNSTESTNKIYRMFLHIKNPLLRVE